MVFVERDWPWRSRDLAGAVLAIGWLVEGRVSIVRVLPAANGEGPSGDYAAVAGFELDDDDAAGVPVVVLFQEQRALPPAAMFARKEIETAFRTMYLGSKADFELALGAVRNLNEPSDRTDATLLHFAAEDGFPEAVGTLTARGADLNRRAKGRATPLHRAAANGRTDAVKILLRAGARVDRENRHRQWPVELAVSHGHLEVARVLAAEKLRRESLATALRMAAMHEDGVMIDFLLDQGAGRHVPSLDDNIVAYAVASGDAKRVERLLAAGWKPAARGALPAAASRRADVMDIVLAAGADKDGTTRNGTTPLMIAAWNGELAVVESLLRAGADVNKANGRGDSAVFLARVAGHQEVADLLQLRGATTPADASAEQARRDQPRGLDDYFDLGAHRVYAEAEVDRPPVVRVGGLPDLTPIAEFAVEQLYTTTTMTNPLTGEVTERRMISPTYRSVTPIVASNHWAIVTLVVEPDGKPTRVQAIHGNSPEFRQTARAAVSNSECIPGEINGRPVRTQVVLAVTYHP